jgi:hypothetical protein
MTLQRLEEAMQVIAELCCGGDLPDDWKISIEMERGSGQVILTKPDGDNYEDENLAEESFAEMLARLVDHARVTDGLEPTGLLGET